MKFDRCLSEWNFARIRGLFIVTVFDLFLVYVIWRCDVGLKSHPNDCRSPQSKPRIRKVFFVSVHLVTSLILLYFHENVNIIKYKIRTHISVSLVFIQYGTYCTKSIISCTILTFCICFADADFVYHIEDHNSTQLLYSETGLYKDIHAPIFALKHILCVLLRTKELALLMPWYHYENIYKNYIQYTLRFKDAKLTNFKKIIVTFSYCRLKTLIVGTRWNASMRQF